MLWGQAQPMEFDEKSEQFHRGWYEYSATALNTRRGGQTADEKAD